MQSEPTPAAVDNVISPPPVPASKYGGYTIADARENAFLKALILGPPKSGKSTQIVGTAPRPLIASCDGRSGLISPATIYPDQQWCAAFDVLTIKGWNDFQSTAAKAVRAGDCGSIVIDTLTFLAFNIRDQLKDRKVQGFDLWNEYDDEFRRGLERILELPTHVFLTAHLDAEHEGGAGSMPLIPGNQARKYIAGRVNQWVMLEYDPSRKPNRQFILTPQKEWRGGCRGVVKSATCDATVQALADAVGITL